MTVAGGPVLVEVSGDRLRATYRIRGDEASARAMAEAIAVEQTVEFPRAYLPAGNIETEVVARLEALSPDGTGAFTATLSFAAETTGNELPQLLNVVWGNVSLLPGVRLVDLTLPGRLLSALGGPRFGREGLRRRLGAQAQGRALVATALKPMGLGPEALAARAAAFSRGGIDIVKDDHGLSDQPFAPWRERVARVAAAVAESNARTGTTTLYMPNVSAPHDEVRARALEAKRLGAGGLLVSPGLVGFDAMRALARDEALDLPILAHPAFLGSLVASDDCGMSHAVLFGTLMRLGGADAAIFPNAGGRFSFPAETCRALARACGAPLGDYPATFPTPGGGMTLERVPEMLAMYGEDVLLLIGGALFAQGDPEGASRRFAALVHDAHGSPATPPPAPYGGGTRP